MKKDILIAITLFAMVVSVCCVYIQYRTIRRQKAELVKYKAVINDYVNYYNATEDLLEVMDADINISATYMCGELGANYYIAYSKINDSVRAKPSN